MALAGKNPRVIVRTGTGRSGTVRAAISTNGGESWSALVREPASSAGAGSIAVSADGKTIVWTPRRSVPSYSTDRGNQWTACAGIDSHARVVADAVNPLRFYTFDPRAGKLLASTNGAADFAATEAAFPVDGRFAGQFGFGGVPLSATPDREGDVWLVFYANGLYHSTNGGTTFVKLERVPEAYSLGFGKAAAGRDYPALYLAGKIGSAQGLFRSDDAGTSWVRINDDQHQYGSISRVTGDPRIYGRVYFATGGRGIIYGDPAPTQARNGL
jgi:xyloglucan-specific exo-beta-1,4-glucanase